MTDIQYSVAGVKHRIGFRSVVFPDGRTLTIRPTTGADVDSVASLYEDLDVDDLRYRFFSVYHPPRSFYERQAHLDDSGGCGLIATFGNRVIGEAGFVPLPDGGAEFALTVARDWRGWLGPYLLDALVEVAAARGLPNLQADVLPDNRRMLALLQQRGYVVIANDDYSVMRVAIATTELVPFWPHRKHAPLVVAEIQGAHWVGERTALRAGWRLISCTRHRSSGRLACPALRGERCALVASADALLIGQSVQEQRGRLLAAHRTLHPGVPVTVLTGNDEAQIDLAMAGVSSRLGRAKGRD